MIVIFCPWSNGSGASEIEFITGITESGPMFAAPGVGYSWSNQMFVPSGYLPIETSVWGTPAPTA